MLPLLITALVAGLFQAPVSQGTTKSAKLKVAAPAETKAARDLRMKWWREITRAR